MNINIREYKPTDEEGVYKINKLTLEISFKSLYSIFHRNNPDLFLIAENTLSGQIIGFILVTITKKFELSESGLIYAIGIHPDYQKKGIGKKLIDELKENLLIRKIKSIYLHVKESNNSAIKFYSNLGFKKLELIEKFYSWGESAYRMKLDIPVNN